MSSDLPTDINAVQKFTKEETYEMAANEIDRLFELSESLNEKIKQLQAENEKLKEKLNS